MRISSSYIYRAILLVNMFLFFGQSYSYAQFSMGNTLAPLPGNFYPIIYSNDVKGGFHQVATIAERNAIPSLRRQLGMVCTVLDAGSGTPVTYQLLGGLLDANWTVFASSAATSGNFADLTNKPTTIAGYGITDATTITGTANQISASASSGAVTLSLPATITGLTSVTSAEFVGALSGNASTVTTNANLTGEVTSTGNATTVSNAAVIGKVLTGFTSGAGTITATDNILQAIQKLDGNIATGTGSMAGDVSGTVGANVVGKINGVALGITTATDKNILVANGTNWNSQAMSGDVTIANTGATTITDKAVTLAKMDDMATGSLIYRKTALAGAPEVQSLATLKTDLGLTGTNTGDQDLTGLTHTNRVALDAVSGINTGDQILPTLSSLGAVAGNTAITAGTNTKITYDAKGLVTGGAAATTADIAASADKNYVTDAQQVVIGNTSGTNTGDQDLTGLTHTNRVALDAVSGINTGDQTLPTLSSLGAVAGNAIITAGTNTKITYDAKGLVTAGAAATTADIAASADKNYVTDAKLVVLNNTSGTNTGDQTITLTGDLTGTGTGSFATTLSASGVTAATYGSATQVPVFAVDAKGRVTGVTNTTITGTSPVGSSLTSANILVGSASDQAAAVAMSGDIAIDNTGATTIGANKVDYGKIQAASTTKKILGSDDASTAVTELSLGFGLGISGSVLSSTVLSDVSFIAPISYVPGRSPMIKMTAATSVVDGYLTAADWSNFNKYNQWDGGSTGLTATTGRTSLGATTIGSNLFTMANPSAVTFPQFNADNTVSALDAATFRSAIGAGTSSASGTVASVSVTTANGVSGSVDTNTTTPAISLTLGAITPTSVAATGTVTGSNLSGTNTGDNAVNSLYSGLTNYTHPTGDGNLHVIATSTTNSGKVLTAGATAGSLSWTTPAAGTVTSVSGTGTVSGLTLTGTVTTSGNLTLGGTLTETDPNVKAINGIVKSNGTTILAAVSGTDYSLVREVADQFTATASQTAFTLTQAPATNSKVKMYINGVRISNTAYSNTGTALTYVPANNGAYVLTAVDRIQFDYYY